jgi:hypothetical protein
MDPTSIALIALINQQNITAPVPPPPPAYIDPSIIAIALINQQNITQSLIDRTLPPVGTGPPLTTNPAGATTPQHAGSAGPSTTGREDASFMAVSEAVELEARSNGLYRLNGLTGLSQPTSTNA